MCKTLRVSPNGYNDWLERPACSQAQANAVLLEQIRQAHADSDATYGVPRIQAELADQFDITCRHLPAVAMGIKRGLVADSCKF
jgi:hypothetical protein